MMSTRKKNNKVQKEGIHKKLGLTYLKIGAITIVIGSIFMLFGLYIDSKSGRYPLFTILLIATSFPMTLFINFKIIKKAVEKLHQ